MPKLQLIALSAFFGFLVSAFYEESMAVRDGYGPHGSALLSACREDNTILQHRYDALAQDSDWLTTVSAEAKYQEGR